MEHVNDHIRTLSANALVHVTKITRGEDALYINGGLEHLYS